MFRLLYAAVLGVVGAAIVHIVVLFLVPMMAPRGAWSMLDSYSDLYRFSAYSQQSPVAASAGVADPFMKSVVCRFDLTDGYVHVFREGKAPFWSASIYDRNGHNVYSLNDRASQQGKLDVVIVTPSQLVDIRKSPPPELDSAVFVEAPIDQGMAVVRVFQPDNGWSGEIDGYLSSIACAPQTP